MRKSGILNPALIEAIAQAGHTQTISVCDAGTPLPRGARVIDLSLLPGIPAITDVVRAICDELCVQSYYFAEESDAENPAFVAFLDRELPGVPHDRVSHEEFKKRLEGTQTIVRTGECSPYANVALIAGVSW